MKIIITKQEAIEAWKDINSDLRLNKDTVIELEKDDIAIAGTTTIQTPQWGHRATPLVTATC